MSVEEELTTDAALQSADVTMASVTCKLVLITDTLHVCQWVMGDEAGICLC